MKKIIALLVITFSIFSFYSCKEDKDNTPTAKPYTNISLQDAKHYVGLDYNTAKTTLEAKGYRLGESYPEEGIYNFVSADNTVLFTLFPNSSNIIFRAHHFKLSNKIDNTLSNFQFCHGQCITEANNGSDFSYTATNDIFNGDIFTSPEEFLSYFNQNKYTMPFCIELWESINSLFYIEFVNETVSENKDIENNTNSNTTTTPTTPEETNPKPYAIGVAFMDKSLAPEVTFDKSNLIRNSGISYLLKR